MNKERHVLLVFPHPDDEAFGTAGTALLHYEMGTPVSYACLTLGEMGRNFGNPQIANRETLPLVRKKELQEAARVMHIENVYMLGYQDKTLEFIDPEKMADHLESLMLEVKPSLVITFYPGHGVHPDHDACGEAVIRAVKRMPSEQRPTVHAIAITKDRIQQLGEPDKVYHVERFIEQKLAAIKAHHSQFQEIAAISEQKLKEGDPNTVQWLHYERFWSYPID